MAVGLLHPASSSVSSQRAARAPSSGWDVELAHTGEPGRRLVLDGVARRVAGEDSLPGLVFFVHQADARGWYGPPGPDSEKPRLAGFVKTGERGEFRIRTILPGTYGGPPHLHVDLRDSLGNMRVSFLNLFPPEEGDYAAYGDGYPRNFRRSRPGVSRDLDVRPDSDGVFRARWDLDVSLAAPNPDHPGWGPEAGPAAGAGHDTAAARAPDPALRWQFDTGG